MKFDDIFVIVAPQNCKDDPSMLNLRLGSANLSFLLSNALKIEHVAFLCWL